METECNGMLVLTRKIGERIVIGEVAIVVSDICGSMVKLAIDAPRDTKVKRGEHLEREEVK
jgi:carbon storage regulator CsrA